MANIFLELEAEKPEGNIFLDAEASGRNIFLEAEATPGRGTLFSGGPLMDVLDVVGVPFSVIPSMVKGAVERRQRAGAGDPEAQRELEWSLGSLLKAPGLIARDLGKGLEERTFFSDVIETAVPGFAAEHPWLTMGGGLGLDIATGGGPARLAGAMARPVLGGAGRLAVAGARAVPGGGPVVGQLQKVGPAVGRIEREARRRLGAGEVPTAGLKTRVERLEGLTEGAPSGIQRAIEEAQTATYRVAGKGAREEAKRLGRVARGAQAAAKTAEARGQRLLREGQKISQQALPAEVRRDVKLIEGAAKYATKPEQAEALLADAESLLVRSGRDQKLANLGLTKILHGRRALAKAAKMREQAKAATSSLEKLTGGDVRGRLGGPKLLLRAMKEGERRAIPRATAEAERAMQQGLRDLAKTAGQQLSDEVGAAMRELQYRSLRGSARAIQAGVLTREGAQKWGKYYVWRGFEKHQHTGEYIARIRQVDPTLAAELERANAARQAFGRGTGSGIPAAARKGRKLLGREAAERLGELPLAERIAVGERHGAVAASEAYRAKEFARGWGQTEAWLAKQSPEVANRYTVINNKNMRWGALTDKPVIPKWLAAHLGIPVEGAGWEGRVARAVAYGLPARAGEHRNWYTHYIVGTWKGLHTAGNLPTQARNSITNAAMTYLVGKIPATHVLPYITKGAVAFKRQTAAYRLAVKLNPGFGATFARSELATLAKAPDDWGRMARALWNSAQTVSEKASRLYEFSELSAKMGIFLYHTERGMPAKRAAELAMRAIFDYGDVSRVTNLLRRWGIAPFITFPVKATKALVPAMVEHPERFGRLARGIMGPAAAIPEKERRQIEASAPDWMSGRIVPILLKTQQGERLTLDVGYMVPWGPWGEKMGLGVTQLNAIPRIVEDVARNKSSFTQREIYPAEMTADVKAQAIADYVWESLGPGWIVRGIPKIIATRKPRYRYGAKPEEVSAERTGRSVAAEMLGVRAKPYVPKRQMVLRRLDAERRIGELETNIRGWRRRAAAGEMNKAQADKLVAKALAQRKKLAEEFREKARAYRGQ